MQTNKPCMQLSCDSGVISSKEDALTLLTKSTNFLAKMKSSATEELQVGNEINVNILTGIGNVMMSSSKQSRIDVADIDPNIDRQKVSR